MWKASELEQSNVAVVELWPSPTTTCSDGGQGEKCRKLFVKRTNVRWLQAKMNKSTEKWAVSVHSFANELNFYAHVDAAAMCSFGAAVPRVLATQTHVAYPQASLEQADDRWFDRQFTTVLEFLSKEEWVEHRAFDLGQTLCALRYLARFHAFHWSEPQEGGCEGKAKGAGRGQALHTLHSAVFSPGAWWRAALRPSVRFHTCPAVFEWLTGAHGLGDPAATAAGAAASACTPASCTSAAGSAAHLRTAENAALVEWLASHVEEISATVAPPGPSLATLAAATALAAEQTPAPVPPGALCPPQASKRRRYYRTLVHGDFKTSNVFFRRPAASSSLSQSTEETTCTRVVHAQQVQPQEAQPPEVVAIDFQWTGRAVSGLADVVYLLLGGTAWESLAPAQAEAAIRAHPWFCPAPPASRSASHALSALPGPVAAYLEHYYACLQEALQGRPTGGSTVAYSMEEVVEEWHWEVADYTKTALPYLLSDLTPALCHANSSKYGWLTHEYDARATVYLLECMLHSVAALQKQQEG